MFFLAKEPDTMIESGILLLFFAFGLIGLGVFMDRAMARLHDAPAEPSEADRRSGLASRGVYGRESPERAP